MENKRTLALAVMSLCACVIFAVAPYNSSRLFWDSTNPYVVFSSGVYSRIIELQDGRLMACCEGAGIKISFSSDKGKTWTTPTKIVQNVNNIPNCVPDVIQLSDGTLIVAYNPRPSVPYSPDRLFGIRCKRSTDGGKNWSEEIWVNDASYTFSDGCWEPSMLELPSGEVQLYFSDEGPYTSSNEQQISMCRSLDRGKTWTSAQIVSYRKGHRDGMPVPILLQDNSTIVVAIEDNGCGYGDFVPATVRCLLETNWNNYWVDANSGNRLAAPDYDFCALAKGGAPYLRKLTSGETVLSHQSALNNGDKRTMYAYVGDKDAKNFKSMTRPFILQADQQALWNSLCVLKDGTILAVASINGTIKMVTGLAMTQFTANYSTPVVDGKQRFNDHYFTTNHNQVKMGSGLGHEVAMDFAYDSDSLYFFCRAADNTQQAEGSNVDGVRLYVETAGAVAVRPMKTSYNYYCELNGNVSRFSGGDRGGWDSSISNGAHLAVKRYIGYYIMELAIPWEDMQLAGPPSNDMRVNIVLYDATAEGIATETIPDAKAQKTWTWMPLQLKVPTGIRTTTVGDEARITLRNSCLDIECREAIDEVAVYAIDGRLMARRKLTGNRLSMPLNTVEPCVVNLQLISGIRITRKIMPEGK
jgi:hypothetical protein